MIADCCAYFVMLMSELNPDSNRAVCGLNTRPEFSSLIIKLQQVVTGRLQSWP